MANGRRGGPARRATSCTPIRRSQGCGICVSTISIVGALTPRAQTPSPPFPSMRVGQWNDGGWGKRYLRPKGIDHAEKRKLIEIGVAGANSPDAVFAQENGGVRVVEQMLPIDLRTNWLAIDHSHLFPWRTSLWLRLNKLGR